MQDRDDPNKEEQRDNVDPRLEMKNVPTNERLPRGTISMPTPGGNKVSSIPPDQRFASATKDGQSSKENLNHDNQKEASPSFERTGDHEVDQHYSQDHNMTEGMDGKEPSVEKLNNRPNRDGRGR